MDGWTIGADVATMLTGLSVVIGGLVGIQLLRPNLDLSLKSEIIHLGEKTAISITAAIENNGRFKITFPLGTTQIIEIQAADEPLWKDAIEYGDFIWSEGTIREIDLLEIEGVKHRAVLRQNESMARSLLVPLPIQTPTAYNVILRVEARARTLLGKEQLLVWVVSPDCNRSHFVFRAGHLMLLAVCLTTWLRDEGARARACQP